MTDFQKLVDALRDNKIPCRVKVVNGELNVECGFNYPDEMVDVIDRIANECGIKNVSICAEVCGPNTTESERVCGGPKKYSRY